LFSDWQFKAITKNRATNNQKMCTRWTRYEKAW